MSALRLLFVDGGRGAYRTPRAHGTAARRCATYRCDGRGAVRAVLTLTRRAPAGRGRGRCRLRGSGGVTGRVFGSVLFGSTRGRSRRARADGPAADASRRMPMLMLICTDMPHKPSNSMPIAHADRVLNPDGGRCRTAASRPSPTQHATRPRLHRTAAARPRRYRPAEARYAAYAPHHTKLYRSRYDLGARALRY